MSAIEITVSGETAELTTEPEQLPVLTSGSIGTYSFGVTADDAWEGMELEIVFVSTSAGYPRVPYIANCIRRTEPISEGLATITESSSAVLKSGNTLYAGITGSDGNGVVRNSTLAKIGKIVEGADPDAPGDGDVSQTRYEELKKRIEESSSATAAQIDQNTADIATLSDALGIGTTADYSFVAGGISSDGTVSNSATNRVRSENYIWAKAGSTIGTKPGSTATFNIATYSNTYTSSLLSYRGMSSNTFVVEQDCYIRFGITASDTSDPNAVAVAAMDLHIITDTLPGVRAQVDQNTKDITALYSTSSEYDVNSEALWESGQINSDGANNTNPARIRTIEYMPGNVLLVESDGQANVRAQLYTDDGTFVKVSDLGFTQSFVVADVLAEDESATKIRLTIQHTDTTTEIDTAFASHVRLMAVTDETLSIEGKAADAMAVGEAINNRLTWRKIAGAELLQAGDSIPLSFQADWVSEIFVRFYVAGDSDTVNPGIRVFVGDFEMCNCECSNVGPDEELYIKTQGKHIGDSIDDMSTIVLALDAEEVVYSGYHGFTSWTNPVTVTLKPYVSDVKFAAESCGEIWVR
ncbi:hypothetical protein [Butyricicoccus sp.]|uniref:hypothetical protein n=1 Tax=Butyricicoccus sp. TaxID=2049021 RepID=UPI003F173398